MNKAFLMGRLTRNPDIKKTNNLTIARFTLAIDRKSKEKATDYPTVVAFGVLAEFVEKYLKQGTKIAVVGRLQTGMYEKDGVKHYTTDVIAESIEFAESKRTETEPQETPSEWIPPEDIEGDLPFK